VFTAREPMTLTRWGAEVTTAFANQTTNAKITLELRPTHNSDTGRVVLDTIELKNGYADGKCYVKLLNDIPVDVGQQVILKMTQQGAGAGGAGAFNPFFDMHPRAEVAAKMSNLVLLNFPAPSSAVESN
jgi:hypothetical protein